MLLTGLGSKYYLLSRFVEYALEGEWCVVIHGFSPSFSLNEFLTVLEARLPGKANENAKQESIVRIGNGSEVVAECSGSVRLSTKALFYYHSFD